jgi:long-chain acyl-CoA synthetase
MPLADSVRTGFVRRFVRLHFGITRRYREWTSDLPADPERPWLREYVSLGIPETTRPIPEVPLHQFLYDAAETDPEEGMIQYGRTVTYPEILADAERLATAMAERGIGHGDRVATILPTSVQFAVVDAAISILGAVHVPNDFLDATEDLEYRLATAEADLLVGHDEHEELVFDLADRVGIDDLILTSVEDYSTDPPTHDDHPRADWLPDVIEGAERDPPDVDIDPESDVKVLLFTGGTTGQPKGVQLSHRNLVANVRQSDALTESFDVGEDTSLLAQPLYHAYGFTSMHGQIHGGSSVALIDDARDVERMARIIDDHDISVVSGVPTQFMELLKTEVDQRLVALSGSAPLAEEVREDFEKDNLGITQGYGLSEMSPTTHADLRGLIDSITGHQSDDERFDMPSIGIPVPDTECKLVDVDSGEEIPISEAVATEAEGELYLNGPQRMLGYLDRPDPFDEEGYIATGDVAKIDPRGRFYIVDRVKDMVNVSGLKVYTNEVDEVLYELEGVARPATVGIPDPDRPGSELVKIYLELQDGADLDEEAVRDHLDGRVPRQAMPEVIEFVDAIPLTDVGKIDKQTLRERNEEPNTAAESADQGT